MTSTGRPSTKNLAHGLAALALVLTMGLLPTALVAQSAQALSLVRITPAGEDVPLGRQIVFQFDRAVVPLGRMARKAHEIPVRIQPRLDCQWRWLDRSALACELAPGQTFARATRYRIAMDAGITSADGARLPSTVTHSFTTSRPAVQWADIHSWLAPERPVFRVTFNDAVSRNSVRAHLFFKTTAAGSGRAAVLAVADHDDALAVLGNTASIAQLAHAALLGSAARRTWLVVPAKPLAADTRFELQVEAGLQGVGPQAGVEQRPIADFATFPAFTFHGVRCTDVNSRQHVDLSVSNGRAGPGVCDPLSGVALLFSTPVHDAGIKAALELQPDLANGRSNYDPWSKRAGVRSTRFVHQRGQIYPLWLPERLQAHQGYQLRNTAHAVLDVFARSLEQPLDMQFGTAHRRPALHLAHQNAVLESGIDSDVPVYVTNLDALQLSYRTLNATQVKNGASSANKLGAADDAVMQKRRIPIPAAADIAFAVPLQTRALLGGKSGAVHGTIRSEPATDTHGDRHFFAQVTPFSVTVKLGHFSSVAWVTRLDDGSPVAGAKLRLYTDRYDILAGPQARPDAARNGVAAALRGPFITDQQGITELPGAAELDPQRQLLQAWRHDKPRLFLRVDKGDELALLPLDNDFRVWTRDVWPSARTAFGHLKAWGMTAQGLYRAGDNIQYKLYVRHQDTHTLTSAPLSGYHLNVWDPKGEAVLEKLPITLNDFGAFDGELKLSDSAAVGWYRFELHSEYGQQAIDVFRVLVSDFTPSPFKVSTLLNGDTFSVGDPLRVDTVATLHAGGAYSKAQARVTVRVAPRPLHSEHPLARQFHFDTSSEQHAAQSWSIVHQDQRALDARGEREAQLILADYGVLYGRLQVESAVHDDRGKRVTALASARFTARDRFVGLRNTQWLHSQGQAARIQYLVVEAGGQPVDNVPVVLAIAREEMFSARVKGAGNAYAARYERRWVEVGDCAGRATLDGSDCVFTPQQAGRYRIRATIADSQGRAQQSELMIWVQGSSQVVWHQPEDNALNIVAERERYEVGDTARYLVRNPFPGAQALVTIERYGILRSWTQQLHGSTPVIEFKIQPDDLPGFHLSVTLMSPRVQAPPPQRGQVDLGKPAMRMGYVRVPVDDPFKRLHVKVTPQHAVYKPRQQARIDFQVSGRDNNDVLNAPVELAIAVLDEAVFDLIGAGSRNFDPYRGFYELDDLDVTSYALLTRLVGRQKFETKGANSGGDGGGQALGLRDLFKFVSYWNPSLPVDAHGHASVQIALPDNLTGWRVLALAVTNTDRLGLGEGSFKVNKDTELRPVMPNQVRAGDRFNAGFTLLNRSAETRTLQISLTASGGALAGDAQNDEAFNRAVNKTITVAPFARQQLAIPISTVRAGEVIITAHAGDQRDSDRTRHILKVLDTRVLDVAASYGDIGDEPVTIDLAVPAQALAGHGAIAVSASPSVIGNAAGAFSYMRDYPYMCWEQRLSKGVMAAHYRHLQAYLPDDLRWPESDSLPMRTLNDAAHFQAPNGGMSYWVATDDRVSPYLSAYTAIAFDWLQRAGNVPPQGVQKRLDDYLQKLLRRDVLPQAFNHDMTVNLRAIALAALARRKALSADDVLRYRAQLPRMSVFAKAHYLEAAFLLLGTHPAVDEALAALLAHGQQAGGKFALSEQFSEDDHYLLETPARANCAALSSLAALSADDTLGKQVQPLLQKMVRSISAARGRRDHWQNTQENAFCMAALADYAQRFEAQPPDLFLSARIDDESLGQARLQSFKDPPVTLSRPIASPDLGRLQRLQLRREGVGRAYYSARVSYALADDAREPLAAGMHLRREFSVQRQGKWTLLESPMQVQRGELLRVDLYLSLPVARHFVVVDDPVPGALEPVNRDLATSSVVDADVAVFQAAQGSWWHQRQAWRSYNADHWSFYHKELRHDSVRFFADYLPAGDYHLSYSAQVIASGEFSVQPALAQEMYNPDIQATGRAARLRSDEQTSR